MGGRRKSIAGEKSVGDFMAFFTAHQALPSSPARLGNLSGRGSRRRRAIERVQALFENPTPTLVSPTTTPRYRGPARRRPTEDSLRGRRLALNEEPARF